MSCDMPVVPEPSAWWLSKYFWIPAILFLALCIRLTGVRHGEPDMVYHPDVAKQTIVAHEVYLDRLNLRTKFKDNLEFTMYPYGMSVIMGNVMRVLRPAIGHVDYSTANRWYWALGMRYLGILLFLVPLAVCMIVLQRKWGSPAAIAAGCMLALEPLHAQLNHYAMNDAPLVGMMLLAWALALLIPDEKRFPIFSLLSGFAAGIGFGIKYQGLLGLVFPGIMWLSQLRKRTWRWSVISACAVAAGFLCGIWLTCPLLFKDPGYYMTALPEFMQWQANIMGTSIPPADKMHTNLYAVMYFLKDAGHWMLVMGAAGAVVFGVWRRAGAVVLAAFSALLFSGLLFMAIFSSRDIVRANDMVHVFMLLIPAWGAWFAYDAKCGGAGVYWTCIAGRAAGIVLIPVFFSIAMLDSIALTRVDTRMLAREWCHANLPLNSSVFYERYVLPLERTDIRQKSCKYIGVHECVDHETALRGFDYLIVSSLASSRFFNRGSPYYNEQSRSAYQWIVSNCTKVAMFKDRELLHAHPEISVYRNERADKSVKARERMEE
jgi:hypothetical protein